MVIREGYFQKGHPAHDFFALPWVPSDIIWLFPTLSLSPLPLVYSFPSNRRCPPSFPVMPFFFKYTARRP